MAYDSADKLSEVDYVMDSWLKLKGNTEVVAAQYEEVHKLM